MADTGVDCDTTILRCVLSDATELIMVQMMPGK